MSMLQPYCREGLDVLFVALNPPVQSHTKGHWFSGKSSRFYHLLHESGLITKFVEKENADEIVFGTTELNYRSSKFGVVDLVPHLVETNSSKVLPTKAMVETLVKSIRIHEPRFVCIIHSKVRKALQRHGDLMSDLEYGDCGAALSDCRSRFYVNYFPNGNNVDDSRKLEIFRKLRRALHP